MLLQQVLSAMNSSVCSATFGTVDFQLKDASSLRFPIFLIVVLLKWMHATHVFFRKCVRCSGSMFDIISFPYTSLFGFS